jgi:Sulfotransferase family
MTSHMFLSQLLRRCFKWRLILRPILGTRMVINTHHKFIFVHIPKVAGTSMMKCLSSLKGNNERWLADNTKHETLKQFEQSIESRMSVFDRVLGRSPEGYYRFAFVRNPWDRMASFYHYLVEKRPVKAIESTVSFKDFLIKSQQKVSWIENLHSMKQQVDYFTLEEGRMKLDFLGHYEFLQEDIKVLEEQLHIIIDMPFLNTSSNTKRDYKDEYDDEMIKIVAARFSDDIALFDYQFDERHPNKRCSGSWEHCRKI